MTMMEIFFRKLMKDFLSEDFQGVLSFFHPSKVDQEFVRCRGCQFCLLGVYFVSTLSLLSGFFVFFILSNAAFTSY